MSVVALVPRHEKALAADEIEIKRFLDLAFKHCGGIEGWMVLRAFEHENDGRLAANFWIPFGDTLPQKAAEIATAVANRPFEARAVFAPPVCIFGEKKNNRDVRTAGEGNVICGPVIVVELDERPSEGLARLRKIIGEPTIVVASGGLWTAPGGETEAKAHAYWRLREPAQSVEALALLKRARLAAARLVGADETAVPVCHPLRWPGSWHTKGEPRLCEIVEADDHRDVELVWAVLELEAALRAAGGEVGPVGQADGKREGFKTKAPWPSESLEDAARRIPNQGRDWHRWNRLGMAFYDASHGGPEGRDAFHAFSAKADVYDPDAVDARWSHYSRSPPTMLSADTLKCEVQRVEQGYMPPHELEAAFEKLTGEPAAPSEPAASIFPEPRPPAPEPIAWIDPEAWADKPIPKREWEVARFIPKGEVTLIYGDGGTGKTLVMHQYAVAASAGVPWLGQLTRQARVMCFFCEDGEDELQRRHADILAALGLRHADTGGRLRIASRRQADNLLALWDRNTGAMRRQAVFDRLVEDAKAFGAEVVIIDTIADVFGGDEVNRAQVTAFVKGVLGRLAHEIGGTVIALGHPSRAGRQSGDGSSGSTGWSNSVRSRLYLRYPDKVTTGNVRELEGIKANYGAKGAKLKIRWARGAFEIIAASTPAGDDRNPVPRAGAVASFESAAERAVVDAILSNPDARITLAGKTSAYYAPKVLRRREPNLLAPFSDEEIETTVGRLERAGILRETILDRSASRHSQRGLLVDTDKLSALDSASHGVFG